MPALEAFGRRWHIASDDLPLPMLSLMTVHTVWRAPPAPCDSARPAVRRPQPSGRPLRSQVYHCLRRICWCAPLPRLCARRHSPDPGAARQAPTRISTPAHTATHSGWAAHSTLVASRWQPPDRRAPRRAGLHAGGHLRVCGRLEHRARHLSLLHERQAHTHTHTHTHTHRPAPPPAARRPPTHRDARPPAAPAPPPRQARCCRRTSGASFRRC